MPFQNSSGTECGTVVHWFSEMNRAQNHALRCTKTYLDLEFKLLQKNDVCQSGWSWCTLVTWWLTKRLTGAAGHAGDAGDRGAAAEHHWARHPGSRPRPRRCHLIWRVQEGEAVHSIAFLSVVFLKKSTFTIITHQKFLFLIWFQSLEKVNIDHKMSISFLRWRLGDFPAGGNTTDVWSFENLQEETRWWKRLIILRKDKTKEPLELHEWVNPISSTDTWRIPENNFSVVKWKVPMSHRDKLTW